MERVKSKKAVAGVNPRTAEFSGDLVVVIKAQNFFFVPFYGALIGFLISKSEYVLLAPLLLKGLLLATFLLCTLHAAVLTRVLFGLEANVFLDKFDNPAGDVSKKSVSSEKSGASLLVLQLVELQIAKGAMIMFRFAMWSLFASACGVLFDIYFGHYLGFHA